MTIPLSVQLYSLREQMKDGKHAEIIKKLGQVGFKGVEGAGLYGLSPKEFRKLVEDNGMVVSSNHSGLPTKDNLQEQIDLHKELGCQFAISGFWINDFATPDAIKATAEKTAFATAAMAKAGLTFALHNHWMEFQLVNGRIAYEWLVESCPSAKFEIDTYWCTNFGANKAPEQVARYKSRTPLLHIKDGPLVKDQPHVAVGSGKMDVPGTIKAADPKVLKWLVVELDNCATDMFQAVADSYAFLVGKGLATGNKPVGGKAAK